ncbi:MAG TPA: acyltransferase family protein [Oculatellaceae cyanobacterium]
MQSTFNEKPRRDHLVEVLRFWACAIVACHHFACEFFPKAEFGSSTSFVLADHPGYAVGRDLSRSFIFDLFNAGSFAVCLFFILSGYILVKPYFAKSELQWTSLSGDAFKRIVRLGLPLLIAIFICFLCMEFGWFQNYGQAVAPFSGSGWAIGFFHDSAFGKQMIWRSLSQPFAYGLDFLPPTWTINVELIGSYLSYGLVGMMHSSPLAWFVGIAAIYLAPTYYKCFAVGVLFAYAETHAPSSLRARWQKIKSSPLFHVVGLILLSGALYLAAYPGQQVPVQDLEGTIFEPLNRFKQICDNTLDLPGTAIPSASCLFVITKLWYDDLRLLDLLAPLGKFTYVVYLAHFIVLGTTVSWAFLLLQQSVPDTSVCLMLTFAYYALCLAGCCALTKYTDGYAIAMSHKLKSYYLKSLSRNS